MSAAQYINKVDHICLAVRDATKACELFIDLMGGSFVGGGDNPRLGARAIQIKLGKIKVELLQPTDPSSLLAKFIERHGEGFQHLTIYVDDVPATDAALREAGFGTVDMSTEHDTWHETFTRPSTTFGALIQLSTPSDPWPDEIPGITLQDVLEGRISVMDNIMQWKDTGEVIPVR